MVSTACLGVTDVGVFRFILNASPKYEKGVCRRLSKITPVVLPKLACVMTRVLNKMNGLMEVSDTQAAAALLGMNTGVCSDIFTSCDMAAYVQEVMQRTE